MVFGEERGIARLKARHSCCLSSFTISMDYKTTLFALFVHIKVFLPADTIHFHHFAIIQNTIVSFCVQLPNSYSRIMLLDMPKVGLRSAFLQSDKYRILIARAMSEKCVYDFSAKDIDGKEVKFDKYRGKVLMVVNVASQCGLTESNYNQLKETLDKYKEKGLAIAAFPCNQFNGQEPGCPIDIKETVNVKYNFEPDLYDKVDVNGDSAHPLWKYLQKEKGGILGWDKIKWNFTKFLIDRNGNVVDRYAPTTEPKKIHGDIEKLLA